MEKEIRLSEHAIAKLQTLAELGLPLTSDLVVQIIRSPDRLENGEEGKYIAQRPMDDRRVLRVVYQEFAAFILVITIYPGRRSRYEKDSI